MHTKAHRRGFGTILSSTTIAEAAGALLQFAIPDPAQQLQKQRGRAQLRVLLLPERKKLLAKIVLSLHQ